MITEFGYWFEVDYGQTLEASKRLREVIQRMKEKGQVPGYRIGGRDKKQLEIIFNDSVNQAQLDQIKNEVKIREYLKL